ncbi:MAG: hypothetical protein P9L94_06300 [Candidatus Hinthialibacter antarcticus]|nr:hypothetical protein [Candidatus Hinthialibacter antarcticus]
MLPRLMIYFFALFASPLACFSLDIGSNLQIFVDQNIIQNLTNTELRLHAPQPAGAVLQFDQPWEGRYCGYATVIKDGDQYALYYRGLPLAKSDGSNAEVTCRAVSDDGINWTKPDYGLFDINGSKQNNVILAETAPCSHNFSPFLDKRPDVPKSEKYKALAGTQNSGLIGFISEDGIHWNKIREKPLITDGAFDSQNVAFWSESENVYVCYFRTWTQGEFKGYRTVSRTTSPDFLNWSEPVEMNFGEPLQEHLYTNQTHPYFRAPNIYISLAARFMPGRRVLSPEAFQKIGGEAQYSGDCSDAVLLTSRGGNTFDRTFREAFIRPGLGIENWSSRTNYPACGVVPTGEREMSLFIQRRYGQEAHYLERLTLRTDGFASVHAGFKTGEMITQPFRFDGEKLLINYSTSAAGLIQVEIQNENGESIKGFSIEESTEIIGDMIKRPVDWIQGNDVSALQGKTIRLRFIMKDADLFSFRFE